MRKTTKRFGLVALVLVAAAGLGACADEPMAVETEETYEVQADETGECTWVGGYYICK